MQKLIETLALRNKTLSTCESFTGGLFAAKLTAVSGASRVFLGSIVAYNTQTKLDLVHADPVVIARYGTISPQAVTEMAEKTRTLFNSDFAIAFSGNAGPTAQEGKPVGLWFGAIAGDKETVVFGGISNLSRNELREAACTEGARNLLEAIRKD